MTPEEKREKQREYDRQRGKDPARRAAVNERGKRYRERHPERIKVYREANKETIRQKKREYDAANRDRDRPRQRRWAQANREKIAEQQRLRRIANPEASRARDIRRAHGREAEEALPVMLAQQNNCCYLCEQPLPKRTVVDHDHTCCPQGKSCSYCRRGVACDRCNRLVGVADDDPELLRKIARNLEAAKQAVQQRLLAKPVQDELTA